MENKKTPACSTKIINKVSYTFNRFGMSKLANSVVGNNQTKENKLLRKASADSVIVEQPLQITLTWLDQGLVESKVFTITMRTPGHDKLLIIGLLHSEGVIRKLSNIEAITCESDDITAEGWQNEWLVQLSAGFIPDLSSLDRYMMSYSSCGLCGTTSLKTLQLKTNINLSFNEHKNILLPESILLLSDKMRSEQSLFDLTGGVHGAALFELQREQQLKLHYIYEDIGRHNAVDKVTGASLSIERLSQKQPLHLLLVSGRISFEIVQKTIMAGVSVLVGVGAPSALAIQAAKQFDITLIGFASEQGFNVYHGDWRLKND